MTISKIIKKYRSENSISQRDFAKLCNLSHTYIATLERDANYINGKPITPTVETVKIDEIKKQIEYMRWKNQNKK